jgi:hypothetical protein
MLHGRDRSTDDNASIRSTYEGVPSGQFVEGQPWDGSNYGRRAYGQLQQISPYVYDSIRQNSEGWHGTELAGRETGAEPGFELRGGEQ